MILQPTEAEAIGNGLARGSWAGPELTAEYFDWLDRPETRELSVVEWTHENVWMRDGTGKLFTIPMAVAMEIAGIVSDI